MPLDDATDDEKAKFNYLFEDVIVKDGSFALSRLYLGSIPVTAVVFIPGLSNDDLEHEMTTRDRVTKEVIVELIFMNDELRQHIRNEDGEYPAVLRVPDIIKANNN